MKVWKQILRAAGYFGIFLGTQVMAYIILSVACSFIAAFRLGPLGLENPQALIDNMMAMYTRYSIAGLIINLILCFGVYLIMFKARKVNPLDQIDFKKTPGVFYPIGIIGGLGAGMFLNYVMAIIPIPESLMEGLYNALEFTIAPPLVLSIITEIIVAPLLEEVVLRGLVFGRLNRAMPAIVAAIITSLIHGLLHGQLIWIIWAFFFSLFATYLRIRCGSIIPCILYHMSANAFAVFINYSGIQEHLSDPHVIVLIVLGALLLVVFFLLASIFGKKAKAEGKLKEPVLEEEELLYARRKKPVNEVVL